MLSFCPLAGSADNDNLVLRKSIEKESPTHEICEDLFCVQSIVFDGEQGNIGLIDAVSTVLQISRHDCGIYPGLNVVGSSRKEGTRNTAANSSSHFRSI